MRPTTALFITALLVLIPAVAARAETISPTTDAGAAEPAAVAAEPEVPRAGADLQAALRDLSKKGPTLHFGEHSTLTLGLRTQFRAEYDSDGDGADLMIRRSRLKAGGTIVPDVRYKLEWKIDDVGREGKDSEAKAEDVSLFVDLDEAAILRIGLYDAPFSRESLTSDSKQILVDRSGLHDLYSGHGLSDNTIGAQVSGFLFDHLEYHVGIFDNEDYDDESDSLMPMGRLVVHLLDRETGDYQASRVGDDRNILNLGGSAGWLSDVEDEDDEFDLFGVEADLFLQLAMGLRFQAEYGLVRRDFRDAGEVTGRGFYVQAGWLFPCDLGPGRPEIAARYESVDPDDDATGDRTRAALLGLNWYVVGHTLKVQLDGGRVWRQDGDDGCLFRLQVQLDF